jgi:serine/threonine-protein kinase
MADDRERDKLEQEAVTTPIGVNTACPQCGAALPAFESRCSACGHQKETSTEEQRDNLRQRLQAGIGDAYELIDMLGKGGMGVVFRATEKALEREVALKVLAFDPLMAPDAFARFEREAKLAARLDHPHIVPIFAVGQGQGVAYYTMRIIRGGSLEDMLARDHKLAPARAIKYLREIALALDHAHGHGVVHRDVKPANVMLSETDNVFVADFGIARAVEGGGGLTSTGVVGSPAYMAPEQWQGGAIDGRADQYALGILAYELLTGRRPYRDATMHQLLRLHLTEDLPDITQDLGPAAGPVRDVLRRATAKDAKERFTSTSEFVTQLDAALGGAGAQAPVAPTVISGRIPARSADGPTPQAAGGGKRRSAIPFAAVAVVILTAGGYAFWNSKRAAAGTGQSAVRPETIMQAAVPETVRLREPTKPETVRLGENAPAGASTGVAAVSPPLPTGSTGAIEPPGAGGRAGRAAYVHIVHPFVQRGRFFIDGVQLAPRLPPIYSVSPGRHVVAFKATVPTFPDSAVFRFPQGDTVRAMFLPVEGGGARGDSMRARLRETLRRIQQNDGRGGRRGQNPRGANRTGRGDTLTSPSRAPR